MIVLLLYAKKAGKKSSLLASLTYSKKDSFKNIYRISIWLLPVRLDVQQYNFKQEINHLHQRALRIFYGNHDYSYKDLLKLYQSFTAHQRNIQFLAIELFKVKQKISIHTMNNIIQMRDNLRSQTSFSEVLLMQVNIWSELTGSVQFKSMEHRTNRN